MNQNNKIFIVASLANGASFSMILPLLAPLVRQLKLSELQGGAMVSVGALLMAISAMYISKNQNRFSIYQLLSFGFVGMAVTWGVFTGILMFGLFAHMTLMLLFGLLMFARASTGVFMAMPQIALQTYVMTRFDHAQARSQQMSKFGALNSVGVIIGPFLTTLLLAWGILAPLWVAIIILSMISAVIIFSYDRRGAVAINSQDSMYDQADVVSSVVVNFSMKNCMLWLVLGFSLYLAIVTLNLTAGFYIQDYFQTTIQQGAVYFSQCSFIVGIALVVMQVLISKHLQWSVQRLLWVGLVTLLVGLVISMHTQNLHVFQATYILYGIAVACLIPAFSTGAAQTAPVHMQAKVASWCTATQALSFVVGPLISTGLYQWHPTLPYYFLILMLCGLIFFFGFKQLVLSKSSEVENL